MNDQLPQVDQEYIKECVNRVKRVNEGHESFVEIYLPGSNFTSGAAGAAQSSYREDLKLLANLYVLEYCDE